MAAVDSRAFLHQALRWTAALAAGVAVLVGLRWDWMLGLSIWIGAGLGVSNLWLLGTSLEGMVRKLEPDGPQAGAGEASPGQPPSRKDTRNALLMGLMLLKLPLLLLAMFVLVRLLPLRLEGVAVGVLVALAGASVAALTTRTAAE